MKEIGGYFGMEALVSCEYYRDLIAVNNARNALIYIIRAKKIKKIYLPFFLCESVQTACIKEGVEVNFYRIDKHFCPVFDKDLRTDEWLYIVNYYGLLKKDRILEYKVRYGNVILDNVQAFFEKPLTGVDTVYSCRKFFGVPDGGYVATDVLLTQQFDTDVSMDRLRHVVGRLEGASASDFYADYKKNDHSFADVELKAMSKFTHNILGAIDYARAKSIREANYQFLHKELGALNGLVCTSGVDISVPVGPYAYPFYCKDGMSIKKQLAARKIYVATLWPNVLDMTQTLEADYAQNILPLPCDQRYDSEDMSFVAEEVKKCLNLL